MKTTIYIAALLILSSCAILRKSKSLDYKQSDSLHYTVADTLSKEVKDSVFVNHEQKEEVNTATFEFDTTDSLQNSDPVIVKIPINGDEYFNMPVHQKVKKLTISTTNKVSNLEGGKLTTGAIQQGHKADDANVVKTESISKESSSKCGIPLINILIIAALAAFIWYAVHWYKSLRIPPL